MTQLFRLVVILPLLLAFSVIGWSFVAASLQLMRWSDKLRGEA